MHLVTRIGATAGCLMILGAALTAWTTGAQHSAPSPGSDRPPTTTDATEPSQPQLTQRRGEWSPICAATGQPLVDFSPIDHGTNLNRLVLTVHNCSGEPVTLGQPTVEVDDSEPVPLHGRTLTPIRLAAWKSAATVLSWQPSGPQRRPVDRLAVRVPGIGEGQLTDVIGPGLGRVRVTQWSS